MFRMFRSMLKIVSNVSKHLYWKKCFVSYVSKHEKLMFQMFRNIKKCTRLPPYCVHTASIKHGDLLLHLMLGIHYYVCPDREHQVPHVWRLVTRGRRLVTGYIFKIERVEFDGDLLPELGDLLLRLVPRK